MKGSDLALLAVAGFVGYPYLKRRKQEPETTINPIEIAQTTAGIPIITGVTNLVETLDEPTNPINQIATNIGQTSGDAVTTVLERLNTHEPINLPSGGTFQLTPNTGTYNGASVIETVYTLPEQQPLVGLGAGFENLLDTIADLKNKVENPVSSMPISTINTSSPVLEVEPVIISSTPRQDIAPIYGLTGLPGQILSGDRLMTPVAPGVYEPYPGWYAQIQAATAAQRAAGFL